MLKKVFMVFCLLMVLTLIIIQVSGGFTNDISKDIVVKDDFSYLEVSDAAPYDSLVSYLSFDGDAENTQRFTAHDFIRYDNDWAAYGNAVVNQNGCLYDGCLQLDGRGDYLLLPSNASIPQDSYEWSKYSGNPVLSKGGAGSWDDSYATFASIVNDSGEIKMYYQGKDGSVSQIGLASSLDGKNFVKYVDNPVFESTADESNKRVPMVWKENNVYHMIYTYGTYPRVIGHATSLDGISWTKDLNNPIFTPSDTGWLGTFENCFSIMKVDDTYLMWYSDWGGHPFGMGRQVGLATTTNLSDWNEYQGSPIFSSSDDSNDKRYSQFCPHSFKYKNYYYILVPSYDSTRDYSWHYLYRDTTPYFLESTRELVRVAIIPGESGWDSIDLDTPWVLTDIENINRIISGDQLWTYYAGDGKLNWAVGLSIEDNITEALEVKPANYTVGDNINDQITDQITVATWVNSDVIKQGTFFIGNTGITSSSYDWGLYQSLGDNTFQFYVRTSSLEWLSSGVTATSGEWHHVVGTYDGAEITIYVDGVKRGSSAQSGIINNRNLPTTIGGGWAGRQWKGKIDETMIFNKSLTESQIQAIYNNQSTRFKQQGNLEKEINISSGNNKVDVLTNYENNFGSNIGLFLGYYVPGSGWNYTVSQDLTGLNTYDISKDSTNLTLNFTFFSDNYQFYTPILRENIEVNVYNVNISDEGITDYTNYWLCTSSSCSSSCQVHIKNGLIVGCV